MENKLIVPQDVYNRIEADALAWSENQYGHDDVNKDYLEGALHEAMIAQAEYVRLKAQPGPRWVKASEFKHEVGMPYHAKDSRFKGAGHFNSNGAFIWGDCTVTHPKDQDDLYILDEQPAAGREEELKVEIERRTKLLEDDLKRDCRLNMPGISEQEQEATWQAYKKRHNL